ncbi:hypothetical protein RHSIM_Rhsim09G0053800 [Rhododendron simsii]|uniref:DUF7794 domain-containing protein n=1 Tax=Rhododendron simsii TaxID=118357 RepID=A0A834LEN3_RHOSS|nr:hypothetical protein RHSIM_Rhsim09G0054400 [Rhododendron simsii]KAF7133437.1 hypothetical protein RHSIM_Rhsim09G0053800 [Rhododendron simsii]
MCYYMQVLKSWCSQLMLYLVLPLGPVRMSLKNEFLVVFLNELLSADADMELTEKEISGLASWLGGTYVAKALEPMTEELTNPLASGSVLNLHKSKKVDRDFIGSLVSLICNIRRQCICIRICLEL